MTFEEWFNSAPHRTKYTNDHPAYLAAQEAWDAAHEECAKVCYGLPWKDMGHIPSNLAFAAAIRARGNT